MDSSNNYLQSFKKLQEKIDLKHLTSAQIDELTTYLKKACDDHKKTNSIKSASILSDCCKEYIDVICSYYASATIYIQASIKLHLTVLKDAIRLIDCKNAEDIISHIFDIILDPSQRSFWLDYCLVKILNEILSDNKNDIVSGRLVVQDMTQFKMMDLIVVCGDFECEASMLELIFRLRKDLKDKKIAEGFFPENIDLQRALTTVNAENFDVDVRFFLNTINAHGKTVASVAAETVFADNRKILPPVEFREIKGNNLWVDFNLKSSGVSLNCATECLLSDEVTDIVVPWENIFIPDSIVKSINIKKKRGFSIMDFDLKDSMLVQLESSKAFVEKCRKMKFAFQNGHDLDVLIDTFLPLIFNCIQKKKPIKLSTSETQKIVYKPLEIKIRNRSSLGSELTSDMQQIAFPISSKRLMSEKSILQVIDSEEDDNDNYRNDDNIHPLESTIADTKVLNNVIQLQKDLSEQNTGPIHETKINSNQFKETQTKRKPKAKRRPPSTLESISEKEETYYITKNYEMFKNQLIANSSPISSNSAKLLTQTTYISCLEEPKNMNDNISKDSMVLEDDIQKHNTSYEVSNEPSVILETQSQSYLSHMSNTNDNKNGFPLINKCLSELEEFEEFFEEIIYSNDIKYEKDLNMVGEVEITKINVAKENLEAFSLNEENKTIRGESTKKNKINKGEVLKAIDEESWEKFEEQANLKPKKGKVQKETPTIIENVNVNIKDSFNCKDAETSEFTKLNKNCQNIDKSEQKPEVQVEVTVRKIKGWVSKKNVSETNECEKVIQNIVNNIQENKYEEKENDTKQIKELKKQEINEGTEVREKRNRKLSKKNKELKVCKEVFQNIDNNIQGNKCEEKEYDTEQIKEVKKQEINEGTEVREKRNRKLSKKMKDLKACEEVFQNIDNNVQENKYEDKEYNIEQIKEVKKQEINKETEVGGKHNRKLSKKMNELKVREEVIQNIDNNIQENKYDEKEYDTDQIKEVKKQEINKETEVGGKRNRKLSKKMNELKVRQEVIQNIDNNIQENKYDEKEYDTDQIKEVKKQEINKETEVLGKRNRKLSKKMNELKVREEVIQNIDNSIQENKYEKKEYDTEQIKEVKKQEINEGSDVRGKRNRKLSKKMKELKVCEEVIQNTDNNIQEHKYEEKEYDTEQIKEVKKQEINKETEVRGKRNRKLSKKMNELKVREEVIENIDNNIQENKYEEKEYDTEQIKEIKKLEINKETEVKGKHSRKLSMKMKELKVLNDNSMNSKGKKNKQVNNNESLNNTNKVSDVIASNSSDEVSKNNKEIEEFSVPTKLEENRFLKIKLHDICANKDRHKTNASSDDLLDFRNPSDTELKEGTDNEFVKDIKKQIIIRDIYIIPNKKQCKGKEKNDRSNKSEIEKEKKAPKRLVANMRIKQAIEKKVCNENGSIVSENKGLEVIDQKYIPDESKVTTIGCFEEIDSPNLISPEEGRSQNSEANEKSPNKTAPKESHYEPNSLTVELGIEEVTSELSLKRKSRDVLSLKSSQCLTKEIAEKNVLNEDGIEEINLPQDEKNGKESKVDENQSIHTLNDFDDNKNDEMEKSQSLHTINYLDRSKGEDDNISEKHTESICLKENNKILNLDSVSRQGEDLDMDNESMATKSRWNDSISSSKLSIMAKTYIESIKKNEPINNKVQTNLTKSDTIITCNNTLKRKQARKLYNANDTSALLFEHLKNENTDKKLFSEQNDNKEKALSINETGYLNEDVEEIKKVTEHTLLIEEKSYLGEEEVNTYEERKEINDLKKASEERITIEKSMNLLHKNDTEFVDEHRDIEEYITEKPKDSNLLKVLFKKREKYYEHCFDSTLDQNVKDTGGVTGKQDNNNTLQNPEAINEEVKENTKRKRKTRSAAKEKNNENNYEHYDKSSKENDNNKFIENENTDDKKLRKIEGNKRKKMNKIVEVIKEYTDSVDNLLGDKNDNLCDTIAQKPPLRRSTRKVLQNKKSSEEIDKKRETNKDVTDINKMEITRKTTEKKLEQADNVTVNEKEGEKIKIVIENAEDIVAQNNEQESLFISEKQNDPKIIQQQMNLENSISKPFSAKRKRDSFDNTFSSNKKTKKRKETLTTNRSYLTNNSAEMDSRAFFDTLFIGKQCNGYNKFYANARCNRSVGRPSRIFRKNDDSHMVLNKKSLIKETQNDKEEIMKCGSSDGIKRIMEYTEKLCISREIIKNEVIKQKFFLKNISTICKEFISEN